MALMTTYIPLLRKDPGSDFGVDFPDFPGCITAGSTLEETRHMAAEALEFHIQGMLEEGLPIPPPSALDAIMADPENAEAIPFPVAVVDHDRTSVQVSLMIPEADLKKVDALARKQGKSRVAVLMDAVRRMITAETDHAA
jgi:predicted RNase H-like HicB family nuclease